MIDITYCSRADCYHLDCLRHQYHAPSGNISIADLNDGLCYDEMVYLPDDKLAADKSRERFLKAICRGTQKTNYKCDDACKALCGNDGTCAYCSIIADAVEEEFRKKD